MKKQVELLMFDLDGTLAATGRDLATSVNYIRAGLGLEPLDEAIVFGRIGHGTEYLLQTTLPDRFLDRFEEILGRFLAHYEAHLLDTTVLYPHVAETLDRFAGKKKAVVTNKRLYLAEAVLRGLGVEKFFDTIVGGDCGLNKKPDPSSIHHVLSRFGVDRNEAMIVGDGETDIDAGKAAGVFTCGVTYGLCAREKLAAFKPDLLIDDLDELADHIC